MKKGAGIDGIRPKDIKNNAKCLTPIITKLINSSLDNAFIPNILKTSIVRPIYKSGTKTDYNNYRPISILPVMEKILEEIVVRRLNNFLEKSKTINKNQFGFQKQKSINGLLGNFANYINNCLSKKMHCLVMFIDFSKAFDTLSHEKLIQTLERNGIRGNTLLWFKNYLECRTYRVRINNTLSEEVKTDYGVPQGSKLGPILYILYANDMLNILKEGKTFAYADDTAIVVSSANIRNGIEIMQNQFNIATKWSHDNGLIINAQKTKLMHIKPPHILDSSIEIKFHDINCLHNSNNYNQNNTNDTCATYIELVTSYKYLGVYVDNKFKWNIHVDNLQKKLRRSAFMLFHLSNCATYSVLRQAYFSIAESYIRHGIAAWGNATHCRLLQNTQNRLFKILKKNQRYCLNVNNNRNIINTNIYINGNNNSNNISVINSNINNSLSYDYNTNLNNNISSNNSNPLYNNNVFTSNAYNNNNAYYNNFNNNNAYSNYNINNIFNSNNINASHNLAKDLHVLNVKSIYYTTLALEFYNDPRFLQPINHHYNTRRRAEGRFKVPSYLNNYGKSTLDVTLPKIFNLLPVNLLQMQNKPKRKTEIKNFFISSQ